MPIQFCGIAGNGPGTEIENRGQGTFDPDYIAKMAKVHDEGDFDRVLIGYRASSPDGWQVASHILHNTDRLGVFVAHRTGVMQPAFFARQVITLDQISGGSRITIHFINGGDEADQHRDGDFVDHDSRYRRTAEYIQVFRRMLDSKEPFDHDGEYYKFQGAFSSLRPVSSKSVQISFGGMSPAALETGARYADIYATWGEPLDSSREFLASVVERAEQVGRQTPPTFHVSLRVILGDTEGAAWDRANKFADAIEERDPAQTALSGRRVGSATTSSVGAKRQLDLAERGDVQDERLFMKISRLQASGGNTAALVGTPEQVADAMLAYYDLGFRNMLIRGFDPFADAVEYGEKLIPLVRQKVAAYDAAHGIS